MSYEAWRISYQSSEQAARAAYVEWKNLLGARPEKERDMQDQLMKFDPTNRTPHPYPSHAAQYRKWHGLTAWLYNPWTGAKRDPRDIGSDVQGLLIAPSDAADECPGCGPDLGPCVCVKVPG